MFMAFAADWGVKEWCVSVSESVLPQRVERESREYYLWSPQWGTAD